MTDNERARIARLEAEVAKAREVLYDLTMLVLRQAQELIGKDEVKAANVLLDTFGQDVDNYPVLDNDQNGPR